MSRMRGLVVALALVGLGSRAEARPTDVAAGELWHYDAGDAIEMHDTPRFRVFYTRAGKNAVPLADANSDGVPDHVADVGRLYEDVLAFYLGRGYLAPLSDSALGNNGGDGRFDVYLLDFAGKADGTFSRQSCDGPRCIGYMIQENDFVGYSYPSATIGNRILSSHEFFHAVQAAYNADLDSVIAEGTAVWSTEQFDPTLSDFEGFIGAFLSAIDRSIDKASVGPVPAFAYGSALFFQFLGEKLDVAVVRKLYEDCVPGAHGVAAPVWLPTLEVLVARDYATSFGALFTEFATWNLYTRLRADPARAYQRADAYPPATALVAGLPYEEATLRVFHAATELLQFDVGSRSQLLVEVLPSVGLTADSLANLHVVVAPVMGSKLGAVTTRAATEPALPVAVAGASYVLVEIVNGAASGESTRGVLCIGDPAEVATCKAKHVPVVDTPPAPSASGCALASTSARGSSAALWLLAALFALAARRRRARR